MSKKEDEITNLAKEGALNLIELIKEYKMKNNGKSSLKAFTQTFQARITEEIDAALKDFIESVESREDNQLSLEFATDIFDVMDALTNDADISATQLQEVLVSGQSSTTKELIETFIESHKEKNTFVQKLTEKIKEGKLKNHSEIDTIRGYRQTSEARKDIMRGLKKQKISIDNDVIQRFLENMSVATKAEVLVKLEKYIESGWYEKDQPLKAYMEDEMFKGKVDFAVDCLKTAMEIRFSQAKFERIVEREENLQFRTFAIDINDERKASVFSLARAGEKDFCIRSVDGKRILIGDVTSEETGEMNKNSWLSGLKAAKRYEEQNGIKIDYSVSIVSLFYDEDESELKGKFLNKLNNVNQEFIDNFHFLQFISVLSRDTKDFAYDTVELLNNVKVNFIGASSENTCNEMLSLKGGDFVGNAINIADKVMTKLIQDRKIENGQIAIFNGESATSTVESVPLSVLFRAVKGLSTLVIDYPEYESEYNKLADKIQSLQDAMVYGGELFNLSEDALMTIQTLSFLKKREKKAKEKYQEFIEIKQKREEKQKEFLERHNNLLKENQEAIIKLLKDMKLFVSSFSNLNNDIDKMRKRKSAFIDNEVTIDIYLALNKFMEDPNIQKSLVAMTPSFKKEALNGVPSPRSVLFQFAQAINASYGKDALALFKNLDKAIEEMKNLTNNPQKYVESQCNSHSLQMAKKNIEGLKSFNEDEIKSFLAVRVNEVNEFLSSLVVNINSQKEQIGNMINNKVVKKPSV